MRQQVQQAVRQFFADELGSPPVRDLLYRTVWERVDELRADDHGAAPGDVRQPVDEEIDAIVKLIRERGGQRS